ncbi:fibronectin type III domain-containing protein [Catellatospora vulcania]|uniref:fibronectin type III domain-containing protein n=1 Tax=Catellatospora vulcania TaxID=1460450 RepID=UPI0012D43A8E|nr:fibronectin type III domain-containing protein [Catellatospora vulcania]
MGQLLADVTAGQDAADVHQRLLDRFDATDHDRRVEAMELGRHEFTDMWNALRHGRDLPPTAWERVVLPTVVAFGNPQTEKIHLELATAYWLAARAAVDAVPDFSRAVAEMAAAEAATQVQAGPQASPAASVRPATAVEVTFATAMPTAARARSARSRPGRRVLIAVAVGVLTTVTVTVLLLHGPTVDTPVAAEAALPSPDPTSVTTTGGPVPPMLPTTPPSASPQPSPIITGAPMPSPVWSPPTASTTTPGAAPSAPRQLIAVAADAHNIWLSWSAPAAGGSGGVAFYRIQRDGQFIGWTSDTSVTVTDLTPATTYTFAVVARNGAGLQSGPSNQITVTTAPTPPQPSPTAAPSSADTTSPAPSLSPPPSSEQPPSPSAAPASEPAVPAVETSLVVPSSPTAVIGSGQAVRT